MKYDNIMYTMHRYIDVTEEKPCENALLESVVAQGIPVFVSEWGTSAEEEAVLKERGVR